MDVQPVQPIVEACFNEAYTFKQAIAFFKHVCLKASFRIEKDKISIVQSDASGTILVSWVIKTSQLINYKFNAINENGQLVDLLYVGFEISELYKTTKSIHKNDSMTLILMPGEKSIYINISNKSSGERSSLNIIQMIDLEPEIYNDVAYNRTEDNPNYRMASDVFGNLCSDLTQLKCTHAVFLGYDAGLSIKGILPSKSIGKIVSFGKCMYEDDEQTYKTDAFNSQLSELLKRVQISKTEAKTSGLKLVVKTKEDLMSVRVNSRYIKPMAKFGSLNGKGIMKITIEEKKPLKILIDVGQYSMLTILIRDYEC